MVAPPRALSLLSLPHGAPPGGGGNGYAGEPIPSRRLILLLVIQRYDGRGSTPLMRRCEYNDAFRVMGEVGGGEVDTHMRCQEEHIISIVNDSPGKSEMN